MAFTAILVISLIGLSYCHGTYVVPAQSYPNVWQSFGISPSNVLYGSPQRDVDNTNSLNVGFTNGNAYTTFPCIPYDQNYIPFIYVNTGWGCQDGSQVTNNVVKSKKNEIKEGTVNLIDINDEHNIEYQKVDQSRVKKITELQQREQHRYQNKEEKEKWLAENQQKRQQYLKEYRQKEQLRLEEYKKEQVQKLEKHRREEEKRLQKHRQENETKLQQKWSQDSEKLQRNYNEELKKLQVLMEKKHQELDENIKKRYQEIDETIKRDMEIWQEKLQQQWARWSSESSSQSTATRSSSKKQSQITEHQSIGYPVYSPPLNVNPINIECIDTQLCDSTLNNCCSFNTFGTSAAVEVVQDAGNDEDREDDEDESEVQNELITGDDIKERTRFEFPGGPLPQAPSQKVSHNVAVAGSTTSSPGDEDLLQAPTNHDYTPTFCNYPQKAFWLNIICNPS